MHKEDINNKRKRIAKLSIAEKDLLLGYAFSLQKDEDNWCCKYML